MLSNIGNPGYPMAREYGDREHGILALADFRARRVPGWPMNV